MRKMPAPKPSPITGNLEVLGYDASYSWPDPKVMAPGYTFAMGLPVAHTF